MSNLSVPMLILLIMGLLSALVMGPTAWSVARFYRKRLSRLAALSIDLQSRLLAQTEAQQALLREQSSLLNVLDSKLQDQSAVQQEFLSLLAEVLVTSTAYSGEPDRYEDDMDPPTIEWLSRWEGWDTDQQALMLLFGSSHRRRLLMFTTDAVLVGGMPILPLRRRGFVRVLLAGLDVPLVPISSSGAQHDSSSSETEDRSSPTTTTSQDPTGDPEHFVQQWT